MSKYLNESDLDVILDMGIPFPDIFHDEVAQLTAELDSGRTASYHHTVQKPLLFLFRYAYDMEIGSSYRED